MIEPGTPRILVIAGTDSSGGAGLTRDTAMAQRLGCSVAPVVTAVTAQTSTALTSLWPVPPEDIAAQITAALREAPVQAIKIGMLGTPEAARAVAELLPPEMPVVLDPVLKTSSGGTLGDLISLAPLLRRVTLLTPNLQESASLSGQPVSAALPDLQLQAKILMGWNGKTDPAGSSVQVAHTSGPNAVLIKGGHAKGAISTDHLFQPGRHDAYHAPRLPHGHRGTGCALATAISCQLAQGHALEEACARAKTALTEWLVQQQID